MNVPNKFDVVEWMTKHGHPGYGNKIAEYRNLIEVAKCDGDREHGMTMIAMYEAEIETVRREAQDRYDDWATDIDYE